MKQSNIQLHLELSTHLYLKLWDQEEQISHFRYEMNTELTKSKQTKKFNRLL